MHYLLMELYASNQEISSMRKNKYTHTMVKSLSQDFRGHVFWHVRHSLKG